MRGHVEVHDASAVVGEDEEAIQDPESSCRNAEEVASDGLGQVVAKKGDPTRRACPAAPHVLLHGGLGDVVAQQRQLGLDALGTPKRIFAGHPLDEVNELPRDRRPASSPGSGLPLPEEFETLSMPAHDSSGLDQHEARSPVLPRPR